MAGGSILRVDATRTALPRIIVRAPEILINIGTILMSQLILSTKYLDKTYASAVNAWHVKFGCEWSPFRKGFFVFGVLHSLCTRSSYLEIKHETQNFTFCPKVDT